MRLIDAEELLEHLEACLQNGRPLSNLYDLSEIVHYVKSMPTASPWHRVEEELPDDSRDVIIFTASKIIGVGSFIRPNWYQWYSGGGLPVDVTYWMPLPEPPKEE